MLRDNVLMYFASPKDFTGFRDKPSGIVLLEECNVRTRDDRASAQRFQFVLSHPNGESVVLAAESEKEMLEWMQAVRTSRICVADAEAATQAEALRRDGAERELDGALSGGVQGDAALVSIDAELEAVQLEHRDVEIEKEKAEKELKARAPTSTRSRARSPSSSPLVPSAPPPPPPLPLLPSPPLPPSSTSPLPLTPSPVRPGCCAPGAHGPFQVAQGTASLAPPQADAIVPHARHCRLPGANRRGDARARRRLSPRWPRGHLAFLDANSARGVAGDGDKSGRGRTTRRDVCRDGSRGGRTAEGRGSKAQERGNAHEGARAQEGGRGARGGGGGGGRRPRVGSDAHPTPRRARRRRHAISSGFC